MPPPCLESILRFNKRSVSVIAMAVTTIVVLICAIQNFQGMVKAQQQQPNVSLQEFEWKASGVIYQARTQMVILTNQLMTNATIITHIAEGNASLLLTNLYNEINKGIAEAQVKAMQIETSFQTNFSKRAEDVMKKAAAIYTQVEASLRNSTNLIEETVVRLLNNTEEELAKTLNSARAAFMRDSPEAEPNVESSINESEAP